jgi:hypothetical protein
MLQIHIAKLGIEVITSLYLFLVPVPRTRHHQMTVKDHLSSTRQVAHCRNRLLLDSHPEVSLHTMADLHNHFLSAVVVLFH